MSRCCCHYTYFFWWYLLPWISGVTEACLPILSQTLFMRFNEDLIQLLECHYLNLDLFHILYLHLDLNWLQDEVYSCYKTYLRYYFQLEYFCKMHSYFHTFVFQAFLPLLSCEDQSEKSHLHDWNYLIMVDFKTRMPGNALSEFLGSKVFWCRVSRRMEAQGLEKLCLSSEPRFLALAWRLLKLRLQFPQDAFVSFSLGSLQTQDLFFLPT